MQLYGGDDAEIVVAKPAKLRRVHRKSMIYKIKRGMGDNVSRQAYLYQLHGWGADLRSEADA